MTTLRRIELARDETGPALEALDAWTPATSPAGPLHAGDVGWLLRFDEVTVHMWSDGDEPVAVGFLDGPVLRVSLKPGFDSELIADDASQLVGDGEAWCDGIAALISRGWTVEPDPWLHFLMPAPEVAGHFPDLDPADAADAADRVAVQRAAFEKSTFTVERWKAMRSSPAADRCVEVLVRTPAGEPAAAVTGWLAGPGRCALLEPVGTHPDHRGHGYGRQAVKATCEALAARGASAILVLTNSTKEAAVALYRSAGFEVVDERRDLYRATPPPA